MSTLWQDIRDIFFSGSGIAVKYSTMHLIVPTVVIAVLVLLCVVMLIQRAIKCKREGKPFFRFKEYRFFGKTFQPFVFFTTIALMVLYFWLLPEMHFLAGSIVFLFLFNLLYNRPIVPNVQEDGTCTGYTFRWKSVLVSLAISVAAPTLIWYVFGELFNLTLP